MPKRLQEVRDALNDALAEPTSRLAAYFGAASVLFLACLLPNLDLVRFILREGAFDARLKAVSILQVLWSGRLMLIHDGRWPILLLALCFGLDAALIAHHLKHRARLRREAGAGAFGMAIGLLGVGCASCGSVFFAGLLSAGATVGVLEWLPLHGQEFTWIGIAAVLASIVSVSRKIVAPAVCAIPKNR